MKLVSVVIPTHNRSDLLIKAIESVLNQTYNNIEIIIVDDASTDDTEYKIKNLKNDKLKYVKVKESKGGNFARNLGVNNAKGSYAAFLDDDDIWMPTKIEKQVDIIEKNKSVGLVYTGKEIIYTKNDNKYDKIPEETGDLSRKILMTNHIGTTSSVMVNKELFNDVGGFDNDMPALQDYDLWIRMSQKTKVGAVKEPLIKYYNHDSGGQISDNLFKIENAYEKIDNKYKDLVQKLDKKEQSERIVQRFNFFGKRKLRVGAKKEGRKYFRKAFSERPNLNSVLLYCGSFLKFDTLVKLKGR